MRTRRQLHPSRAIPAIIGALVVLAWIPAAAPPAAAAPHLSGYADVTAVQTETDGLESDTIKQEYNAIWSGSLSPYLSFRASFRYYKFDLDQQLLAGAFREEYQPAGEITWKHPLFMLGASAFRRHATATASAANLITDNFLVTLSTRDVRYPLLRLRYDWQHIFDTLDDADERDTRDRRLQGTADYTTGDHSFTYSFTRRLNENVISGLESRQNTHLFRWSGLASPREDGRLQVSTYYTFNRNSQTDVLLGAGTVIEPVPVASGLYAEDSSPEFGSLEVVAGLADGNDDDPTLPAIDIGGALGDRTLGVDLGFPRRASTLYVYTDRASGVQPQWRVFTSADNLSWQLWTATPTVAFNAGLSRYEIAFPAVEARYLKAVKDGLNEVGEVLVTEIQAFQELADADRLTRVRTAHLADVRAGYRFSDRVNAAVDVSVQDERNEARRGDRRSLDYALLGRFRQTGVISHHLRWEQSFRESETESDLRDNSASYTLLAQPLETLNGTASLNNRLGFVAGQRDQEITSALAEINGTPTYGLSMSAEVGKTRSRQFQQGTRFDTWSLGGSVDAAVSRTIDAIFTYSFQRIGSLPDDLTRNRHLYGIGLEFRLTRDIFARGSVNIVDDVSDNMSQDYLLSWNLTPKLTMTALAFLAEADDVQETERYSVNANYEISARSSLYARYTRVDLTGAGGGRTTSFQQGLRIGF